MWPRRGPCCACCLRGRLQSWFSLCHRGPGQDQDELWAGARDGPPQRVSVAFPRRLLGLPPARGRDLSESGGQGQARPSFFDSRLCPCRVPRAPWELSLSVLHGQGQAPASPAFPAFRTLQPRALGRGTGCAPGCAACAEQVPRALLRAPGPSARGQGERAPAPAGGCAGRPGFWVGAGSACRGPGRGTVCVQCGVPVRRYTHRHLKS